MIVRPAPALPPADAARRGAAGADPAWLSSPGAAVTGDAEIAFDAVATDPVEVVRGGDVDELQRAWQAARRSWAATGPVAPEIPIAVGWLSYDLARRWTPLPARARDDHGWPELEFRFYDAVWMQPVAGAAARIWARDDAAAARLAARLERPAPPLPPPGLGALVAGPEGARTHHAASVARIQEYLRAGDTYQVNLARRLTASIGPGDPLWLAEALRAHAPAPHAIWLGGRSSPEAGGGTGGGTGASLGSIDRIVVGNSPERFLRLEPDGRIETRPIKGTRARGTDARLDAAARAALAASAKDRAEHVMIVDLERNDLGRVCEIGSVTVEGLLRVVALPTVFHLATTVRGQVRPGIGLGELLRATFPGGSITGAPKRRAMEIIEELEPVRRGIYTGATGWLGAAGDLDLAVAIRTATIADGQLSLSIGGGIVVDSDAAAEWEETEVKARAFQSLQPSPPLTDPAR